ncbi:MAG TPA: MetQ/NlpA family ABC transporter substrate-binding protein, partial [Savagea sp.]
MKKLFRMSLLLVISALLLAACGGDKEEESKTLSEDKVLVGVTGGPHEQIFEVVKEVAAKDGLEVELKVFSDYIMPNKALAEGQLDVNSYQHKP